MLGKSKKLAVGLMSGTSIDGIDAALVELEGFGFSTQVKLIHFVTVPYTLEEKEQILRLCHNSTATVDQICEMNVVLGKRFAEVALETIIAAGYMPQDIDFISSHGQTIYHLPDRQATLQIGDLAHLAQATGCLTVGDYRPSDMAAGGQGAPLVPYVDYLLFRKEDQGRILLNIGGMSNLTVLPAGCTEEEVIAFDTGPGNVLIDGFVQKGTAGQQSFDQHGDIAARGKVDSAWLNLMLARDTNLTQKPPKSTGREYYSLNLVEQLWLEGIGGGLSFEDMMATITQYTVESIIRNIQLYIEPHYHIEEILVGGGGVHNKGIMKGLEQGLKQRVLVMDAIGFSSDAKEAIAFAILGNEFLHGQTNNLPAATGASKKVSMGKLALP